MADEPVYDESQLEVLSGIEAIRRRPGMYFGEIGLPAMHHLIDQVVDCFVEEAFMGACNHISIVLRPEAEVVVRGDDAGWPVAIHEHVGRSRLQMLLTESWIPGYRFGEIPVHGGPHGIGIIAINAMSEWMIVESARDNFVWRIKCAKGVVEDKLRQVRALRPLEAPSTTVTFRPDFTIFQPNEFDFDRLVNRSHEITCVMPELTISLRDERGAEPRDLVFMEPRGLCALVEHITAPHERLYSPIVANLDLAVPEYEFNLQLDFVIQFTDRTDFVIMSYSNTVPTIHGGTETKGFRQGLAKGLNVHRPTGVSPFRGSSEIAGAIIAISVIYPNPQYESMAKVRVMNYEFVRPISQAVKQEVDRFATTHPDQMQRIIEHCIANRTRR